MKFAYPCIALGKCLVVARQNSQAVQSETYQIIEYENESLFSLGYPFFFKSFWSCSENLKRPFILAIIKMGSEILSIEASVLALKNHSSIFHWISINGHELFGVVNKLRNFFAITSIGNRNKHKLNSHHASFMAKKIMNQNIWLIFSKIWLQTLKVRWSQTVCMKSSIFQNIAEKIWYISALKVYSD